MVVALAESADTLLEAILLEKLFIHMIFALAKDQRNEFLGVFPRVFENFPHLFGEFKVAGNILGPSQPDTSPDCCNEMFLEIMKGGSFGLVRNRGTFVRDRTLFVNFIWLPALVLLLYNFNRFLSGHGLVLLFIGLEHQELADVLIFIGWHSIRLSMKGHKLLFQILSHNYYRAKLNFKKPF